MKRIAIIGSPGSGKSVFAKKLGDILNIPVIHLDSYYWQPNWKKLDSQKWSEIHSELIIGDEWIIDGNYKSTMDVRLGAADTIIFLNFSRWLCFWRIVKRRLMYHGKTRGDLGGNNYERTSWQLISFVMRYQQAQVVEKLAALKNTKEVITLMSPKDAELYLDRFSKVME